MFTNECLQFVAEGRILPNVYRTLRTSKLLPRQTEARLFPPENAFRCTHERRPAINGGLGQKVCREVFTPSNNVRSGFCRTDCITGHCLRRIHEDFPARRSESLQTCFAKSSQVAFLLRFYAFCCIAFATELGSVQQLFTGKYFTWSLEGELALHPMRVDVTTNRNGTFINIRKAGYYFVYAQVLEKMFLKYLLLFQSHYVPALEDMLVAPIPLHLNCFLPQRTPCKIKYLPYSLGCFSFNILCCCCFCSATSTKQIILNIFDLAIILRNFIADQWQKND